MAKIARVDVISRRSIEEFDKALSGHVTMLQNRGYELSIQYQLTDHLASAMILCTVVDEVKTQDDNPIEHEVRYIKKRYAELRNQGFID